MKKVDLIESYININNGIITTAFCRENNIPTTYLSRLEKQGRITKLFQGLYLSEDADFDEIYFFQYRFKKAIFSYETALSLIHQTDLIISRIDVTVPYHYKFNQLPKANINYIDPKYHLLGVIEVKTIYGNKVLSYSYERVVCDMIINKAKIERELYINTIKGYQYYQNKDIRSLFEIAQKMNILLVVQEIMELII